MDYLRLSDEALLKECDWYAGRASGPGGQARNKTHSAIRIVHRPTGVTTIANESRLQGENRALALERLRHALALEVRHDIDPETFEVPAELREQVNTKGRLAVNVKNARYPIILATLLDLLAFYRGQVAKAAERAGITTTNFVNVLHDDPKAWTVAQRIRQKYGLPALKA